jgi:short-subunit dehydrogenase
MPKRARALRRRPGRRPRALRSICTGRAGAHIHREVNMGSINGKAVVVTGASSGIGRATALELARRGVDLCLVARRDGLLADLALECQREGVTAIAVAGDISQDGVADAVAARAAEELGRLDGWINNAGVTALGKFEEIPRASFRRVMDINFFGAVEGARAVLPYFRAARRGVLVNVGSMVSRLSEPFASAYVASKHALRGFGQSLRQELRLAGMRTIHVCTVMPAMIDTPLLEHAANYSGRALSAMPPVYRAEDVAVTIAELLARPRREVFVGNSGRTMQLMSHLAPDTTEGMMARHAAKNHFDHSRLAPSTDGNLFNPVAAGIGASGGWRRDGQRGRRTLPRMVTRGALPLAAAAGLLWLAPRLAGR